MGQEQDKDAFKIRVSTQVDEQTAQALEKLVKEEMIPTASVLRRLLVRELRDRGLLPPH